jgi:menaquinone-dependent protoporphyrinogen oxidase
MSKVLVAYASRCGSTGEIAAAIGEELCAAGAEVVVRPVGEVKSLDGFDALVLGSATRMGKLLPEATSFLKKNASAPAMTRVVYFTAGTGPLDPNPVTREEGITKPVGEWRAIREPLAYRVFAGKVDHLKMAFPVKQMFSFVKDGVMADADHRDFDAIRAWAREIAPSLRAA